MASSKSRIAILGCGFMGTAILQGLLVGDESAVDSRAYEFSACVRSQKSLDRLQSRLSVYSTKVELAAGEEAASHLASRADVVILGCAPSDLDPLLATQGIAAALRGKVVISLLAGVSIESIREIFKSHGGDAAHLQIARMLPTLGAQIRKSVTLSAEPICSELDTHRKTIVTTLFRQIGTVLPVPEHLMLEATALNALCHALSIVTVDTLSDAAASKGLPRSTAMTIVLQCLNSAASLMLGNMTPEYMKIAMAIPSGITINSILRLEQEARPAIANAAREAIDYTRNL